MVEKVKVKYRMGKAGMAFWMGAAIIADLITLIPFAGDIVGPLFWICVSIYLWKIGCGLLNARRLATSVISMIAEMIPGAQEFPLLVLGMLAIILMIRIEDKTGVNISGKLGKKGAGGHVKDGVNPPKMQQAPLNQDGVRAPNGGLPPSK